MKNIVKTIKTIKFLQDMRFRNKSHYDLDDCIWEKMESIRKELNKELRHENRETGRKNRKIFNLACRMLKVDAHEIMHY